MFNLDVNAAKKSERTGFYINESGKYFGEILVAEWNENHATGSKNIVITYKSDEDQKATIWLNTGFIDKKTGLPAKNETNLGKLSAILACLRMRSTGGITKKNIKKWNKEVGQEVDVLCDVFDDLSGKKLGMLIQMEIDKKAQGDDPRPSPILLAPFEYSTELMATEILDKKTSPELLAT